MFRLIEPSSVQFINHIDVHIVGSQIFTDCMTVKGTNDYHNIKPRQYVIVKVYELAVLWLK
jgi:hypothetical protein